MLINGSPKELGQYYDQAKAALEINNFEGRNTAAARVIAEVETADIARDYKISDEEQIRQIFKVILTACLYSGAEYRTRGCFDEEGKPNLGMEVTYKATHPFAGEQARKYLPALVRAVVGVGMDDETVRGIASSITYKDVFEIVRSRVPLTLPNDPTNEKIYETLKSVVRESDPYGQDVLKQVHKELEIDGLGERFFKNIGGLDRNERAVIDLGLRLAHSTWALTQLVAQAPWDLAADEFRQKKKGLSATTQKPTFNPSSLYLQILYDLLISGERGQYTKEQASVKVVFDAYRDADNLR